MGDFLEALRSEPPHRPNSKRRDIEVALRDKEDGSWEEFCEAMVNNRISARVLANAVTRSTSIEVSDSMILRWRNQWASS